MIPRDYITEWREQAPWVDDAQVEQDLAISRALVAIFSNEILRDALTFRGGTALYKLYLPAARYSEDIDLVQKRSEPAGAILAALREVLDPIFGNEPGTSNYDRGEARVACRYRFQSEDGQTLRLKVEINTREHFSVEGIKEIPFSVNSRWYTGACRIPGYELNELLGTKLRALYQRKKGRDLFDLAMGLDHEDAAPEKIITSFHAYMAHGGHKVTGRQFERNLAKKMKDSNFTSDLGALLASGYKWDFDQMAEKVSQALISRL